MGDIAHVSKEIPGLRMRGGASKARIGGRARFDVEKGGDDPGV